MPSIRIVGGGLAGCEAAWQAASRGVPVTLYEMRPARRTAVHRGDGLAEVHAPAGPKPRPPRAAVQMWLLEAGPSGPA